MKLVKGQATYPMPPHSHVSHAWIYSNGDPRTNPGSYRIQLLQVPMEAIEAIRKKVKAATGKDDVASFPRIFAIDVIESTVTFNPTPNADYLAGIIYAGPLQEI